MYVTIPNGTTLTRVHGTSTELLAAFQYDGCAAQYAAAKLAEDAERGWFDSHYIACNSYDGRIKIFRHDPKAKSAKAA